MGAAAHAFEPGPRRRYRRNPIAGMAEEALRRLKTRLN